MVNSIFVCVYHYLKLIVEEISACYPVYHSTPIVSVQASRYKSLSWRINLLIQQMSLSILQL